MWGSQPPPVQYKITLPRQQQSDSPLPEFLQIRREAEEEGNLQLRINLRLAAATRQPGNSQLIAAKRAAGNELFARLLRPFHLVFQFMD
jgi:hypothetical protein